MIREEKLGHCKEENYNRRGERDEKQYTQKIITTDYRDQKKNKLTLSIQSEKGNTIHIKIRK